MLLEICEKMLGFYSCCSVKRTNSAYAKSVVHFKELSLFIFSQRQFMEKKKCCFEQDFDVIHLSKYYKPHNGGVESVVCDLAESSGGFKVGVVAVDAKRGSFEIINDVSIFRGSVNVNVSSAPFSLGYIRNVLRLSKGGVIHVHLPNPLANLSVLVAAWAGRDISKLVLHWHSDIVKQKKMLVLYRPLLNWLLKKATLIIVTSEAYLLMSEQLRNVKDKCRVVPIGIGSLAPAVDMEKVKEVKDAYLNERVVFSLGRHIYYKGFEDLIAAASQVENAIFLIGGEGPDTAKYHKIIQEMELDDKVKLIGRVAEEELPSLYAAADVFCLPSKEKSEAFGVVQLEAMSVGTPVVSTNIQGSGVPWVNKHDESGIVCEPGRPEELARAITYLLDNPQERARLGAGAKQRFEEVFERQKMVAEVDKIYRSLLGPVDEAEI
ncbi:glycosyltransferase [Halomonas sp. WWR20]